MAETTSTGKTSPKLLLVLHAMLLLFSLSSVCAKLAGGYEFMSPGFILCYGGMLAILGIYAIGWQQIIKRMPLTAAYTNRAVTLVWGIVWGVIFFNEKVTPLKLAGAAIVLVGIVLYALAGDEDAQEGAGGA